MASLADVDEVMYAAGVEILHPGGLPKTDEMMQRCHIGPGQRVLDVGTGKGATACALAREYACSVVGIDLSPRMITACRERARREGLAHLVTFEVADAQALPFSCGSFDIAMAECVTTLMDKRRALGEMARVTKAAGYVADLEMIWRRPPPPQAEAGFREAWEGYETMTLEGWRKLFQDAGLTDIQAVDFSGPPESLERETRQALGLRGELKLTARLLVRWDLARAMYLYWRLFRTHSAYVGYAYFVGRRPAH